MTEPVAVLDTVWAALQAPVRRHADAGYEDALACARDHHLDLPGILR